MGAVVATCFTARCAPTSAAVGVYADGLDCNGLTEVVQVAEVSPLQRYHCSLTSGGGNPVHVPAFAVSALPTPSSPLIAGAPHSARASGAASASAASTAARTAAASSRGRDLWSVRAYAPVPAGYDCDRAAAMGNRRPAAKVRARCPSPVAACTSSESEGQA